jgi:murein DD-endopeptidase MepM/ murein hydrolase activator NlpD
VGHGAAGENHAAYDIACETGECLGLPIASPVAGTVVCAGFGQGTGGSVGGCNYSAGTTNPGMAHTVVIEAGRDAAGNPVQLSFNHMGTADLVPGQQVAVGDIIGTMGSNDQVSAGGGPHLHLEGWVGDPATGYQIVDPTLIVGGYYGGGGPLPGAPTSAPAATGPGMPTLDWLGGLTGRMPAAPVAAAAPPAQPSGWAYEGTPPEYVPIIEAAAVAEDVPPQILDSLLWAESQYDPNALSPAGAQGIAQFMPDTARGYGIDPADPAQAIPAAATYLGDAYRQYGSWELALASYNAGHGAVQEYGGVPPFPETQAYVAKILKAAGLA